jgi:HEPN domain-containing protein
VVLFHCQQAADKWLKAFLIGSGVEPPLIHALGPLLDVATATASDLEELREDAELRSAWLCWLLAPPPIASPAKA